MTGQRNIERMLDRWFEDGAREVPERVVDRALNNIEHIPQRRASRGPRRFSDMPTSLRLLGLAAALVVAGGAAYVVSGGIRTPDSSGAPTDLLETTGATWSATRPSVFGFPAGTYQFDTYSDLVARAPDGSVIALGPVLSWDGRTAVIGLIPACPEQSTYSLTTSADHLSATATAVKETCAERRALIEGSWQRLSSDSGLELSHRYTVDMGVQVTFRVPDWPGIPSAGPYAYTEGAPGQLPRMLRVGTDRPGSAMTDYELRFVVDPRPAKDVCDPNKGALAAGWTVADYTNPARAGSMASFSRPVRTRIGGYDVTYVDVKVSPSCGRQIVTDPGCCPDDVLLNGTSGRLWVIDVGGRLFVAQFVRYDSELTSEQLGIGQQLLDSFEFQSPSR